MAPPDMTPPALVADMTEATDTHDMIASSDTAEPIPRIEPKEPIDPIEHAEPTLPIDRTEFFDAIERTDPLDQSESTDFSFFMALPSFASEATRGCGRGGSHVQVAVDARSELSLSAIVGTSEPRSSSRTRIRES